MAPGKLPPKPTVGPLIRRTLFAAALGVAGCGGDQHPKAARIGPTPRIGAAVDPYWDEEPPAPPPDAGPLADATASELAAPTDAGAARAAGADAAVPSAQGNPETQVVPVAPRIGPAVKPDDRKRRIRIGPPKRPRSTVIRGVAGDDAGRPLGHCSLHIVVGDGTRIVSTDAGGRFALDGLAPGRYRAQIRCAGFAPATVELTAESRTSAPEAVTVSLRAI